MRIKYLFAFIFFLILSVFVVGIRDLKASNPGATGSSHIYGYAWSSNIGWISFNNCSSSTSCTGTSYGVSVNTTTGVMSGYAWSSNVGWISFQETSGCPVTPCTQPKVNLNTGDITGWAKVVGQVSLDKDGWIALSSNDAKYIGTPWGLKLSGGEITGFAWGDTMVGWISANCSNIQGSCGASDYKLKLNLTLIAPTIVLTATPNRVPSSGADVLLSWTSTDSTLKSCSTSGEGFTPTSPTYNGAFNVKSVKQTTVFKITCTSSSFGLVSSSAVVDVIIDSLVPNSLYTDGNCVVTWTSNAPTCSLTPSLSFTYQNGNGAVTAPIPVNSSLNITCGNRTETVICKAPAIKIKPHYQEQ